MNASLTIANRSGDVGGGRALRLGSVGAVTAFAPAAQADSVPIVRSSFGGGSGGSFIG